MTSVDDYALAGLILFWIIVGEFLAVILLATCRARGPKEMDGCPTGP